MSFAALLSGTGSESGLGRAIAAAFDSDRFAVVDATRQAAVYSAVPPVGRLTRSTRLPVPVGLHALPVLAMQVQVHARSAGNASVTVAPLTSSGPALRAVIA